MKLEYDSKMATWARQHPYHYLFKGWAENNGDAAAPWAFLGVVFALASWIATIVMLITLPLLGTPILLGVSIYGLVAFSYWFHTKNYFANWQVSRLWQKAKNWWQSRIPAEIQQAKKLQSNLAGIIKSRKKSSLKSLLNKVNAFIEKELPRLLNLRTELEKDVVNAREIIQREKANGICDGEDKLMAESEEGLKTLQVRLEKTKKKIEYGLSFLDHLIIRVELITSTDSLEESRNEIAEIQEELDIMIKAHEEVGNDLRENEKIIVEDNFQEKAGNFQPEKVLTA
ncbi:MAG: hypothetical protein A2Y82_00255 [Candidatus Buchananbacteria bacterium RBG_13_36_9]|uniref:Uncharacterized protein n=1 Tax=Candidatus Buchananbacteria bacterium RBG_13_36_9 TaxID=1797530 RepID=A0A1G1XPL7_9BACT|nr:MAG: hypothetical protein A2Y82_00255 [Candidatus Buchananbacteria bacterium RBG_13_36_9]